MKNFSIENIHLLEPRDVEHLYPFSVLHCAWELRIGAFRIFEKWKKLFPGSSLSFSGREEHIRSFLARYPQTGGSTEGGATLLIFGNILPSRELVTQLASHFSPDKNILLTVGSRIVGALIPEKNLPADSSGFYLDELPGKKLEISSHRIGYLWQALDLVGGEIEEDTAFFAKAKFAEKNFYTVNEDAIYCSESVNIGPGVVLDASEGPIIIGDNARIFPNSVILGPCFIGENTLIKAGAKIYEKTSIGEFCKVGGEVENSIILGYSNKQHDGFLGHSYLCEWVNLGADTNTSDLKNTYGRISVKLRGEEIDTGRMFLGLLCGDHTKSGINTMFTTGTVAGISSNVVGAGYPPAMIPSYSWGGMKDSPHYELDKAIEVARTVMGRRKKTLLPEEETLLKREFARPG